MARERGMMVEKGRGKVKEKEVVGKAEFPNRPIHHQWHHHHKPWGAKEVGEQGRSVIHRNEGVQVSWREGTGTCAKTHPPRKVGGAPSFPPGSHSSPAGILSPKLTSPIPKGVWRALDLFSGSGSVAKTLRKLGWEVVTLDNASRVRADIPMDIMDWKFWEVPKGYFQLVAASPPCQEYSQAKTMGSRDLEGADRLVRRTLDIIAHFDPPLWWLENPRGGQLKDRGLLDRFPFVDVDYCQFEGWGYKKPTRIWGSSQIRLLSPKLCHPECPNRDPHTRKHFQQLGGYGPQVSTWNKGRIPEGLIKYLLSSAPEVGPGNQAPVWGEEGRDENLFPPSFSRSPRAFPRDVHVQAGRSGYDGTAHGGLCTAHGGLHGGLTLAKEVCFKQPMVSPHGLQVRTGGGSSHGGHMEVTVPGVQQLPPAPPSVVFDSHKVHQVQVREVVVPLYALGRSNQVHPKSRELQLVLPLTLLVGDREVVKVKALVDTGAQANLINDSLIPQNCLQWAREQLHLVAANGLSIPGGNYEVHTRTTLQQVTKNGNLVGVQDLEVSFHVARLGLDAILSYPWLAANGLVVGPQENSLMLPHPEQLFLQPWGQGVQWMSVERDGGEGMDAVKVGGECVGLCVIRKCNQVGDQKGGAYLDASLACECVGACVGAPGLEDSPGQPEEALQGIEPRPRPGVGKGEPGSGGFPGSALTGTCHHTRPWQAPLTPLVQGDSLDQLEGNLHKFQSRSRPGEGQDETGLGDSPTQLEGVLPSQSNPRPRPVHRVGACVVVCVDDLGDASSRVAGVKEARQDVSQGEEERGQCARMREAKKFPTSPTTSVSSVPSTLPKVQTSDTKDYSPSVPKSLPSRRLTENHVPPEVTFFGISYPLWEDASEGLGREVNTYAVSPRSARRLGRKRSDYWTTQRYSVRPEVVLEVLEIFGVEPEVDVFADKENHVLERWWGKGGEKEDAWEGSWDFREQGYLWMNPPFGVLWEVVDKIVEDGARVILICPNWPRDKWWKKLRALAVDEVWYPKGTKIFIREGELMPGTKLGVHAYLVDGTLGLTDRVANKLKSDTKKVSGKITPVNMFKFGEQGKTGWDDEGKVEEYRKKIHEDFDGTVLGSKVPRDPPIRGLFGEARIDLVDGATPVRQKPFVLHGERLEAHKKVTLDWLENGFIEPIPGGKEA